jgi:hypothetical protein
VWVHSSPESIALSALCGIASHTAAHAAAPANEGSHGRDDRGPLCGKEGSGGGSYGGKPGASTSDLRAGTLHWRAVSERQLPKGSGEAAPAELRCQERIRDPLVADSGLWPVPWVEDCFVGKGEDLAPNGGHQRLEVSTRQVGPAN